MFNLIGIPTNIRKAKGIHVIYGKRVLADRLKRAISWYRNNFYYVDSSNILYRIIENFAMPKNLPDEYIEQYVYNRAFIHGNAMGLNNDRSLGKLFYGNFYGSNTIDIITMIEGDWKWDYVKKYWMDLSSVRVLRHNQTHLSYNLMSRKNYVEKEGFCVVEVDIVLLHLQYMAFLRHHKQVKFVNSEHTIPNIGYFLGMIVLPNMLISHFNQVIINRFCLETDEMMSETMDYCGTSFYINPNSKLIENDIEEVFKNARRNSWDIKEICTNLVGVDDIRAIEYQDTPKVFLSRNNKWVYLLAVSRFLISCLMTPNRQDRYVNQGYLNRLQIEMRSYNKGQVFSDPKIRDLKEYWDMELGWLLNVKTDSLFE